MTWTSIGTVLTLALALATGGCHRSAATADNRPAAATPASPAPTTAPTTATAPASGTPTAPSAGPSPAGLPPGVLCTATTRDSFHLRPEATDESTGTEYPAGTVVGVISVDEEHTRHATQMYAVKVLSDGAAGHVFLGSTELAEACPPVVRQPAEAIACQERCAAPLHAAHDRCVGDCTRRGERGGGFLESCQDDAFVACLRDQCHVEPAPTRGDPRADRPPGRASPARGWRWRWRSSPPPPRPAARASRPSLPVAPRATADATPDARRRSAAQHHRPGRRGAALPPGSPARGDGQRGGRRRGPHARLRPRRRRHARHAHHPRRRLRRAQQLPLERLPDGPRLRRVARPGVQHAGLAPAARAHPRAPRARGHDPRLARGVHPAAGVRRCPLRARGGARVRA